MALDCGVLRDLARRGRIRPSTKYRADLVHPVAWRDIMRLIVGCHSVRPDNRTGPDGRPLHPNGYVVRCRDWNARIHPIDLDFLIREDLVEIVTAMELEVPE